jgi:hypothetical protein
MTVERSALLLARLRAEGSVPAVEAAGTDIASAAAEIGRRSVRVGSSIRLGWADGHDPDPDGPPTARLSAFPTGVLAALLALGWTDASTDPLPGQLLPEDATEQLAAILDRDPKVIAKYLAELRERGLVSSDDDGCLRIGPAIATWTPRTVTALRRHHHLLAAARGGIK